MGDAPDPQGADPASLALSVVEFGADEFEASLGDAVRPALRRRDRPFPLQLPEKFEIKARVAPAVAGQADHGLDLPVVVFLDFDPPALGEQVQDALLYARYVHVWMSPGKPGRTARGPHSQNKKPPPRLFTARGFWFSRPAFSRRSGP
ncbi:protein of unknown function [Aminobacter niigataensis]|nr:protein of unknown function [Aminobacter niigataensis]